MCRLGLPLTSLRTLQLELLLRARCRPSVADGTGGGDPAELGPRERAGGSPPAPSIARKAARRSNGRSSAILDRATSTAVSSLARSHVTTSWHCKAGRDRTGVVVAVLLLILGVPKDKILEEFLEAGGENARSSDLQRSFDGIVNRGGVDKYFEGLIDVDVVRRLFIPNVSADGSFLDLHNLCQKHFLEARQAICQKRDSAIACEKLLEVCESGVKLQPEDIEMHAGMGWALVQLGRRGDANRAFTEGLRLAVSTSARDDIKRMMRREMRALTQIEESGHC